MPAADPELSSYIRRLEIPDCGCPCAPLDCGCELRLAGKPCDCPVVLPPPCEHILSRQCSMPLETWVSLLNLVYPRQYTEPPLPDEPHEVMSKTARVEIMVRRAAITRPGGSPQRAIRHPGDLDPRDVDHASRTVRLAGNGRPMDAGLICSSGHRGQKATWPHLAALPEKPTAAEVHRAMVKLSKALDGAA